MKKLVLILFALALTMPMWAQSKAKTTKTTPKSAATTEVKEEPLPKVYEEGRDGMEQIEMGLEEARNSERLLICQVGGNWCPWCLRFAKLITEDEEIAKVVKENFVYIHVNTSKENKNFEALKRLENPGRFGYPALVVLDREGRVIHIQNSAYLEEGKGYDRKKVLEFFQNWTIKAIEEIK